jgi:hypothetical protein
MYVGTESAHTAGLYVDGVVQSGTSRVSTGNYNVGAGGQNIGYDPNFAVNDYWQGNIDEVKISNVTRSAGWIGTEYSNQYSTSTFYRIGSQESGSDYIQNTYTYTYATPALAQATSTYNQTAGLTSISKAFGSDTTAGNTIIAGVYMGGTSKIATVASSQGDMFTKVADIAQTTDGHQIAIFYAKNIKGGPTTVTASWSGGSMDGYNAIHIFEFSGLDTADPFDKAATSTGASTSQTSGNTATISQANELLFGFFGENNILTYPTMTATGVFTRGIEVAGSNKSNSFSEYGVVSSAGAYSANSTSGSSQNYSAAIATFKAASISSDSTTTTTTTTSGPITILGNLNIGGSGSATINASTTVTSMSIAGNLTIGSLGTFSAPITTMTISKDFTNNGIFTNNGGTVKFDSSSATNISGNTTFYSLISTTTGKIFNIQASTIVTIAGLLNLMGGEGTTNFVTLQSATPNSQWFVHFNSDQSSLQYVFIKDAGCHSGSKVMNLSGSVMNNGGNDLTCWKFPTPSGGGSVSATTDGTGGVGILVGGGNPGGGTPPVEGGGAGGTPVGGGGAGGSGAPPSP